MSESNLAGSIADRIKAHRATGPRVEDLIFLPQVALFMSVACDLTECEAGKALVEELQGAASHLPLFRVYMGDRVETVSSHRELAQPGDFSRRYSHLTEFPSARDTALRDLPLALIYGHPLGDASNRGAHQAASLAILRTDFEAHFRASLAQATLTTAAPMHDVSPLCLAVLKPAKKPGDPWTASARAELLRQFEALRSSEPRAKVQGLHERLGEAWCYSANSIKNFIAQARSGRKPLGVRSHRT